MIVAPWCLTLDLNGLLHTQEEESHSWWRWPTPRSVPGCQRTSTRTTWFTAGPVRNMLSAPRGVASASMWLGSSYEPSLNVWVDGLTIFKQPMLIILIQAVVLQAPVWFWIAGWWSLGCAASFPSTKRHSTPQPCDRGEVKEWGTQAQKGTE